MSVARNERKLKVARDAFAANDSETSRYVHDTHSASCEPESSPPPPPPPPRRHSTVGHQRASDIFRTILTCGFGGAATSAVLLGARSKSAVGIVSGLSVMLTAANWISLRYYRRYVHEERTREEWETDNYIDGERAEMIELYEKKGLSREDAERVVRIISQDKRVFVDWMMSDELGLEWPCRVQPSRTALAAGGAFAAAAGAPLVCAHLASTNTNAIRGGIVAACILGGLLGGSTASLTRSSPWQCGAQAAAIVALGAIVAKRFT